MLCVTNADLGCSGVQGVTVGAWWRPAEIGGLPIVVLTSGRILLLAVAADLLQRAGDIWSRPATVNHPDTAGREHIVLTNQTRTDYSSMSVGGWGGLSGCFLLGCRLTNVHLSGAGSMWALDGMQGTNTALIYSERTREALWDPDTLVSGGADGIILPCGRDTLQTQSAISNTPDSLSKMNV